MAKIGINGFGRLGRLLLRVAINKCKQKCAAGEPPRIVMVNDPVLNPNTIKDLFQHDTFQGKSNFDVIETGSSLTIDGQRVEFSSESIVERISWKKADVKYVIDTTGHNTTCEKASMFLTEGIQRVIVHGCSKVPMFVVGVNHCCFDPAMKTLSASSPQMNCATCLLRVLHENFDVQEASMTEIHPLTNDDRILDDVCKGNYRSSRSSLMSFTPTAAMAKNSFLGKIMPELNGKTISNAIKVSAPCVGAIDCTVKLGKEAPLEIINCRLKEASESYMKGLMKFSTEELTSSDVIGDPHSCVIDSKTGSSLSKCTAKIFAWYDTEYGFANRLYELANYISSREDCKS